MAFPPFNLFAVALVALVPITLSLRGESFWRAFRRGYVFGLSFWLVGMFWLAQFVTKWTDNWTMGAIPWVIAAAYLSLHFGLFGGVCAIAWRRNQPWMIPLGWAGCEVIRSVIPAMYFPWAQLGTSFWKLPALMQPAWWGGIYFLSAVYCLFSVFVALMILREPAKRMRLYGGALLLFIVGSVVSFSFEPGGVERTVSAVQIGTDMAFADRATQHREISAKTPKALMIASHRTIDLTLLPEGISRWENGASQPDLLFDPLLLSDAILGGQRNEGGHTFQSAFAVTKDGEWTYADKTRLVIFGEYVPFRDRLGFLENFNLPGGDLTAAETPTLLQLGDMKIGPLVCFEALFEEVARDLLRNGADILIIPSNDDWFHGTGAIAHLQAVAVTRAVESRVAVIKSSSLGTCIIVDARGTIVAETMVGKPSRIVATVKSSNSNVFFLRDAFPWIATLAVLYLLAMARFGSTQR